MILNVIIHSSKIKVITLLEEWFHHIKSIFICLPSDEDLIYKATKIVEQYRSAKDECEYETNESENETSEDTDDEATTINLIDNEKD